MTQDNAENEANPIAIALGYLEAFAAEFDVAEHYEHIIAEARAALAALQPSPLSGDEVERIKGIETSLRQAIEIIERHCPIDALGSNWDGNDEVPGGVRSWPIKDEYLHYMRQSADDCAALASLQDRRDPIREALSGFLLLCDRLANGETVTRSEWEAVENPARQALESKTHDHS